MVVTVTLNSMVVHSTAGYGAMLFLVMIGCLIIVEAISGHHNPKLIRLRQSVRACLVPLALITAVVVCQQLIHVGAP